MTAALAPPAIPAGARHLPGDRWAHCDPGLADSPAWTRLLAALVADVPALRSVSVQLGTTPPDLAGLTRVEIDDDGRASIAVTVAPDLDRAEEHRVIRHEIGHCADAAARLLDLDDPGQLHASHSARPLGEAFAEHCETWLTPTTAAAALLAAAHAWTPTTAKENPMPAATSPARFRHQVDEDALRRADLDDYAFRLGPAGCVVELAERAAAVAAAGGTDESLPALFRRLREILPAARSALPTAHLPGEQALQAAVLAAGGAASVPVAEVRAVDTDRLETLGLAVLGKLPRTGDAVLYLPGAGQAGALLAEIAAGVLDGPVRRALEERFNARRPEPSWAELAPVDVLDEVHRLAADVAAGGAKTEHTQYLVNGARHLARLVYAAAPVHDELRDPLPSAVAPLPEATHRLADRVRAVRGYTVVPAGEVRRALEGLDAGAVGLGLVPGVLPDDDRMPVTVHVAAGRVGQLLAATAAGDDDTATALVDQLRTTLTGPEPATED